MTPKWTDGDGLAWPYCRTSIHNPAGACNGVRYECKYLRSNVPGTKATLGGGSGFYSNGCAAESMQNVQGMQSSIPHPHSISILTMQFSCNAALPSSLHCNMGRLVCSHHSAASTSCTGVSPARFVGPRYLDERGEGWRNEPIG